MARRTVCGLSRACAWKTTMQSSRALWWFIGSLLLSVPRLTCRCKSGCTSMQFRYGRRVPMHAIIAICWIVAVYRFGRSVVSSTAARVSGTVYTQSARQRSQDHVCMRPVSPGPPDPVAGAAIGACHGGGVGDRGAGAHGGAGCHLALSGGETFGGWGPTGRRGAPWKRI